MFFWNTFLLCAECLTGMTLASMYHARTRMVSHTSTLHTRTHTQITHTHNTHISYTHTHTINCNVYLTYNLHWFPTSVALYTAANCAIWRGSKPYLQNTFIRCVWQPSSYMSCLSFYLLSQHTVNICHWRIFWELKNLFLRIQQSP